MGHLKGRENRYHPQAEKFMPETICYLSRKKEDKNVRERWRKKNETFLQLLHILTRVLWMKAIAYMFDNKLSHLFPISENLLLRNHLHCELLTISRKTLTNVCDQIIVNREFIFNRRIQLKMYLWMVLENSTAYPNLYLLYRNEQFIVILYVKYRV